MHEFPLLQRVSELYEDINLDNSLLLSCQHLLAPQQRMFTHLLELGLPPQNCVIVGKNYSTCQEVMDELGTTGCAVAPFSSEFKPLMSFDSWFEQKLTAYVSSEISRRPMSSYDKVVLLDDGGFMHIVANRLCGNLPGIIGVEQTSSGHHRIHAEGIAFESISVARSYQKLMFETPYIADIGHARALRHYRTCGNRKARILFMGMGPIGRQMAGRALVVDGFEGAVFDPHFDLLRTKPVGSIGVFDLFENEHVIRTEEELWRRIREFDIIVGSSGTQLFGAERIEELHPEVSLISMSSSDREFPALPFRRSETKVHDNCRLGGRSLINAGFPITFDGKRNACPPQQIEFTMALLMIRVLAAIAPELQDVSCAIEQIRCMWEPDAGSDLWYHAFNNELRTA
jgi:hypothetical protein